MHTDDLAYIQNCSRNDWYLHQAACKVICEVRFPFHLTGTHTADQLVVVKSSVHDLLFRPFFAPNARVKNLTSANHPLQLDFSHTSWFVNYFFVRLIVAGERVGMFEDVLLLSIIFSELPQRVCFQFCCDDDLRGCPYIT